MPTRGQVCRDIWTSHPIDRHCEPVSTVHIVCAKNSDGHPPLATVPAQLAQPATGWGWGPGARFLPSLAWCGRIGERVDAKVLGLRLPCTHGERQAGTPFSILVLSHQRFRLEVATHHHGPRFFFDEKWTEASKICVISS